MKTVWMIAIPINVLTASFTSVFDLPKSARFLHCREQGSSLCAWFEVDTEEKTVRRSFQIFGTGTGPIENHLGYLGTGIFADGDLVLHLYQVVG